MEWIINWVFHQAYWKIIWVLPFFSFRDMGILWAVGLEVKGCVEGGFLACVHETCIFSTLDSILELLNPERVPQSVTGSEYCLVP
jgi:hypothetical protein